MSSSSDIHRQSPRAASLVHRFCLVHDREMTLFRGNVASEVKGDEGESSDHVSYPRWMGPCGAV